MDQGDDQLSFPWQSVDFDDGWLLENGWGERALPAASASQDPRSLQAPVWASNIDQPGLSSGRIENDWMLSQDPTCLDLSYNEGSGNIQIHSGSRETLTIFDIPGQENVPSITNFNAVHSEGLHDSYGNHTQFPLVGIPLNGTAAQTGDEQSSSIAGLTQLAHLSGAALNLMTATATSSPGARNKRLQKSTPGKRELSKLANKITKPRISCTYSGCKQTFPRPYELQRHLDNFHNRITIPCIVYGCNRIGRPVSRVDKFREHMKKHANAHTFVCAVEGCPAGPFDRDQLCQHLNAAHNMTSYSEEVIVKERLRAISLRTTPREDGSRFAEGLGNCPLAFLGCNFRATSDDLYDFWDHLKTHDLVERSKGYKAIVENGISSHFVNEGRATCPMCEKLVCGERGNIYRFINHIGNHTKEQRNPHIVELWECIRPFAVFDFFQTYETIQLEYQEATGLPAFEAN